MPIPNIKVNLLSEQPLTECRYDVIADMVANIGMVTIFDCDN